MQCDCLDLVIRNYELKFVNNHSNKFFLSINSIVKMRKLYLIEIILAYIKKKTSQYHKTDFIIWADLTRVAIFNICD